jgi:prevent-host-death family protein
MEERVMRIERPVPRTMKASDVRQQWSQVLRAVHRKEARVLVEKSGIPVAAIVSIEDLERLEQLEAEDRQAWDVLAAMREPFQNVSPEEIEREADRALAEARAARLQKPRSHVVRR